jgi:GH25 family lysozyme M1 (1,4-beta-N-acetylmuramidase)
MTVAFRGMTVWRGADVSGYDPGINWSAYNWDFVYIKATEGTTYRSPAWVSWGYPAQARGRGIHVGAYHYAHPGNAVAQVRFMRSVVGVLQPGDLRPVLDIEGSGWSSSNAPGFAAAFIAECRNQFGCAPTVYCSASFFNNELRGGSGWKAADVPVWVAHYTSAARPAMSGWKVWQYTSTGSIPGSGRPGDVDVCVDLNAILAKPGGGTPTTSYKPLTVAQIAAHGGWKAGDPPVYGILVPVVIRSVDSNGVVHHSTWDARLVPAPNAAKVWIGSGTRPGKSDYLQSLWVNFVRDLMGFTVWPLASADGVHYSYAAHFGVQPGGSKAVNGYFTEDLRLCVMAWSRAQGIPVDDDSVKRGICTTAFWAKCLGQTP